MESLEEIKADDEAIQAFGVQYGVTQSSDLIANGFKFIHYYTMNLESSILKILDGNGTLDKQRHLPFKRMTSADRIEEQVRPIFWANKPKSYVSQTQTWDDFPNGRWGSIESPAFMIDESYISFCKKQSSDP
jgi:methylenetetrahydrofolate reductase (NADPH)